MSTLQRKRMPASRDRLGAGFQRFKEGHWAIKGKAASLDVEAKRWQASTLAAAGLLCLLLLSKIHAVEGDPCEGGKHSAGCSVPVRQHGR